MAFGAASCGLAWPRLPSSPPASARPRRPCSTRLSGSLRARGRGLHLRYPAVAADSRRLRPTSLIRRNSNELRERLPVPWMRDALACLNSGGVRLAHSECRIVFGTSRRWASAGCTCLTYTSRVNQAGRSEGFQFRMACLCIRCVAERFARDSGRCAVLRPTSKFSRVTVTAQSAQKRLSLRICFPQPRQRRSGFGASTVGNDGRPFASRRCCWVNGVGSEREALDVRCLLPKRSRHVFSPRRNELPPDRRSLTQLDAQTAT